MEKKSTGLVKILFYGNVYFFDRVLTLPPRLSPKCPNCFVTHTVSQFLEVTCFVYGIHTYGMVF